MIDLIEQSKNKQMSLNKDFFKELKLIETFCVSADDFKFIVHDTPKIPNGSLFQKDPVLFGVNNLEDQNILINEIISCINLSDNFFLFDHFSTSLVNVKSITDQININKEFVFWYVKNGNEFNPLSMFIQGLRDSLCHGNLYYNNGFYFIFSTSSRDKYNIKFGLQINSFEKIHSIVEVLKKRLVKYGGTL